MDLDVTDFASPSVARTFAEALAHHRAGRLSDAERLYRQILTADPRHADALHSLGIIALQAGHSDAAADLIGKAIAIDGKAASYHSNLGLALQNLGKRDQAAASFERALALKPDYPEAHNNLGVLRQNQGRLAEAASHYERATALRPDFADAHFNLGNVLSSQGRFEEARARFARVVALAPNSADAHNNLGNAVRALGQLEAAALHYERALALRPDFAEAHFNLGNALRDRGNTDAAIARYEKVLALTPDFAEAHIALGNVLLFRGRLDEAIARFRQAITIKPTFAEGHYNLAGALMERGDLEAGIASFAQAAKLKPEFRDAHFNLGSALATQGKFDEAAASFERTLALNPDFAEAHIALGNVLLRLGRSDAAYRSLRRAQQLQPLSRRKGAKPKADFSVLLLTAPGNVNTPSGYLVGRAGYDSSAFIVMPEAKYDLALLRANGDVVVNLISDVDRARDVLPLALELADRLDRPIINHPRKIMATSREEIAARLTGIDRCRIPKTTRLLAGLAAAAIRDVLREFSFPLLVRVSGTHGGVDFEKLYDAEAVLAFISAHAGADHYITEYVAYESLDGHFRKYRLIFVDQKIFPYHLAIGDHWKVHHASTDMAGQAWMRAEEEAFVRDPHGVFKPDQWAALAQIEAEVGLDYCGVDCGIDRNGDVVMFEVNATMLVHDEKTTFAYKAPYIARIKQAFDAMLEKAAVRHDRP